MSKTLVIDDASQTLTNKTLTSPALNTGISGSAFLDEDDMNSNSATKVASQQSIKAYVDRLKNHKARAYSGTGQLNLVNNTYTKVTLGSESYDPNEDFASSAYTVPETGTYRIYGKILFKNCVANTRYTTAIYLNGSLEVSKFLGCGGYTAFHDVDVSCTIELTEGDTIEMYARSNSGGNTVDIQSGDAATYLEIDRRD